MAALEDLIKGLRVTDIDPIMTGCDQYQGITKFEVGPGLIMVLPTKPAIPRNGAVPKDSLDDRKYSTGSEHPYRIIWTDRKYNNGNPSSACYLVIEEDAVSIVECEC